MPVTGSSFTLEHAQADGSRWCREAHTVTGGGTVEIYYLSPANADNNALLAAHATVVNDALEETETEESLERDGAPALTHMTIAQLLVRLRARYRALDKVDLCRLSWWLQRRINAGHITDAQCRTAFAMTNTAWNNFKANKLTPRHDAWAAVLAATGE